MIQVKLKDVIYILYVCVVAIISKRSKISYSLSRKSSYIKQHFNRDGYVSFAITFLFTHKKVKKIISAKIKLFLPHHLLKCDTLIYDLPDLRGNPFLVQFHVIHVQTLRRLTIGESFFTVSLAGNTHDITSILVCYRRT